MLLEVRNKKIGHHSSNLKCQSEINHQNSKSISKVQEMSTNVGHKMGKLKKNKKELTGTFKPNNIYF